MGWFNFFKKETPDIKINTKKLYEEKYGEKTKKLIEELGEKYLLHPNNRIKRKRKYRTVQARTQGV